MENVHPWTFWRRSSPTERMVLAGRRMVVGWLVGVGRRRALEGVDRAATADRKRTVGTRQRGRGVDRRIADS